MNLLLILFIILYSMSKTDVQKAAQVAEAIRNGFNASQTSGTAAEGITSSMVGQATDSAASDASTQDWSDFYNQVNAIIQQAGQQQNVDLSSDSKGLVITLKDNTLYASGSATMNPNGAAMVNQIGNVLRNINYGFIIIEGHTDSDPIRNSSFVDNLDLSTARAANVERALIACGLKDTLMGAMGRGDTVPLVSNTTSENKAKNRRVVITIYKSLKNLTADQFISINDLQSSASQ